MSELVQRLIESTGLNEEQSRQVEKFLVTHALKLPEWLFGSSTLSAALAAKLVAARGGGGQGR